MQAVLSRRDSVVVLPTGGGKSLCFQAPALVLDRIDGQAGRSAATWRQGFALVVSPLISLMKDQVDGLRADGVAAAFLNSTQSTDERNEVIARLRSDQLRLLYVSPERLVGEGSQGFRRLLQEAGVRFVAIDEAHCISQWGHDFRPEYRQLGRLRDDFPDVALHAFTATATERVRHDIVRELRLTNPAVMVGSFDRPNLTYRVWRRATLRRQLEEILGRHQGEAGIIYCLSRREVDGVAEWLQREGRRAVPYHAGLPDEVRSASQEDFLNERADVVVATVAFGMGIDRSNVRFVVHAAAPRSLEHYQQESGRAGRDGLPAECLLIYSGSDFVRWKGMLESNGELTANARELLRDMERYASGTRCRHRHLVEYFGESYSREACGSCDWCLRELDPVADAQVVAQKILSCVARVRQSWGVAHVCDVLLGRATEKVCAEHHDQLSTFGLLKEESASSIRGYIDQLMAGGFLVRHGDPYPTVRLTAAGGALLKGHGSCLLYRQVAPPRGNSRKRGERAAAHGVNPELFEVLRALRSRLARERGVRPYVIFHDTTLREMADRRPSTIDDLYQIYGVGAKKAADFGEVFLDAIRTFRIQN